MRNKIITEMIIIINQYRLTYIIIYFINYIYDNYYELIIRLYLIELFALVT